MEITRLGHRWMMAAALCVVAFGLSGCDDSYTWHQKLTVEVETPQGIKSGSSVQKAKMGTKLHLGAGGKAGYFGRRGEAVIVEVAPDRFLFMLIARGDNLAQYTVLDKAKLRAPLEARGEQLEQIGRKGPVPREHYPMLVTFDDIAKPETVKLVNPDDLAATFGPGYALKSITLEITDEPMTEGRVEKVLGWWCDYRAKYIVDRYAKQVTNEFAREIGGSHFRIGECR